MENNKNQIKSVIISFLFGFIFPVFAYGILKIFHFTDTLALGVATAFPIVLTLYTALKKRKVNPIGLIAICGFLISIVAVYLSHGNDLAFKLWHPILTGGIGIVLLFSAAINHPLMGILGKKNSVSADRIGNGVVNEDDFKMETVENTVSADKNDNESENEKNELSEPQPTARFFMIFTLFMGLVFALHSAGTIMLAFSVSTTAFVLLSKGIDFSAIIVLIIGIYLINKKLD